jgi:hypothetical protein
MVINRDEYVWERHRDTIYVRIQDIQPSIPHPDLPALS